ncbi:MAG: VTC domain-containing protein [bacterium]
MFYTPNDSDDYRYERKFVVSELTKPQIESLIRLHPAAFSEIYYERFVNNIYFDSCTMQNYFANIDGLQNRTKCRIRWYDDLFGFIEKPVLELKIKDGLLGRKESFRLRPFTLDEQFHQDVIREVFQKTDMPAALKADLLCFQPVLLNRYSRRYFQSVDGNYRMTIDTQMAYYRIDPYENTFLQKHKDDDFIIVEMKYNYDRERFAQKISAFFPYRMTKSSKYVNGIQKLFLM